MTKRHLAICKAILEAVHDLDGGQALEVIIHADACKHFRAMIPLNEFNEAFESLNREGCFTGVHSKFKGTLWSMSDKGRQTREEMK